LRVNNITNLYFTLTKVKRLSKTSSLDINKL